MNRYTRIAFLLVIATIHVATAFAQCAQCKAAAGSRDAAGNLIVGGGINAGVLYLLSLPFLLVLIVGGVFYWRTRKMRISKDM
ncbi:MAG: hypothetical protein R3C61_05765 [Bacteroidia bacterium]